MIENNFEHGTQVDHAFGRVTSFAECLCKLWKSADMG
jgi:hypothetical protein